MDCARVVFSGHAVRRMFEREVSKDDVLEVLRHGEIITTYPGDTPYPSFLLPGFVEGSAIHTVVAQNSENNDCYVITAYPPDPELWQQDFKTRK